MRSFERNRNQKSMWQSKPVLILLGLVLIAFVWSVARFALKMGETGRNREIAEEKVAALREQRAALIEDIEKLETDRGKEEVFRENYGLAKEGEEVIIIVEDQTPPPDPKKGIFSGFFSAFKNWLQ